MEKSHIDGKEKHCILSTIDKMAQQGLFGDTKVHSVSFERPTSMRNETNFIAKVTFVKVTVRSSPTSKNPTSDISLVVKSQLLKNTDVHPKHTHLDVRAMFRNEVTTYREILAILGAAELRLFPRLLHGYIGPLPDSDIVVIENITPSGFRSGKKSFGKDEQVVTLVVRKLGEFHGLSYRAKRKNPEVVSFLKRKLTMVKHPSTKEGSSLVHKLLAIKIAENLIRKNVAVDVLKKVTNILKSTDFFMARICEPEEPTAAVTHGDLLFSNMFFKWTEIRGVTEVNFFDLQTCFYGDTVFDLVFFLFTNIDLSLMTAHWDHLIGEYWKGVTRIAPDPGFTIETFKERLARKCFGGFAESCFVLLFLIGTKTGALRLNDLSQMSANELCEQLLEAGSPEGIEKLESLLEFMIKRTYLDRFVDSYTSVIQL